MDRNAIIQMANSDPSFAKAVDAMEAKLADTNIMPEDLDKAIQILEFVVDNPDKYPQVREAAIKDGYLTEDMFPPQYDQIFVVSLLVALYGIQDRLKSRGYSHGGQVRGGLQKAAAHLQAQGRGGDTILAHINPREAEVLQRMGGAGSINPNTGLQEYKGGFFKVLGSILPIALSIIAPGIGTAIGTALGASGTAASMVGGALIGAGSSAIGGGNILQGAALGGLGGGLGSKVGGFANKSLGLGLGSAGQNVLGSALIGGGINAARGQDFLSGAAQGAVGGMLGNAAGGFKAPGVLGRIISAGGQQAGHALAAGYDPKQAAIMGGLSGLASGLQYKAPVSPSDQVVENLTNPSVEATTNFQPTNPYATDLTAPNMTGIEVPGAATPSLTTPGSPGVLGTAPAATAAPAAAPASSGNSGLLGGNSMGKLMLGASVLSALNKAPPQVQQAVSSLSPQQQEYFNRPSVSWDWDKLQRDASASNMDLSRYMASNWPQITSGAYNAAAQPGMSHGGALSNIAYMARGSGSGRSDEIDAKLSDGEFVMDAETVALLGDGSSKRGAEILDQMRMNIRKQKGKALAKGKFSPNAKSPLSYIKGAA